jgi:hypothetical protein
MKYKPTAEDKRIIRSCAQKDAGHKRVKICASTRFSLVNDNLRSMNVAMISDDPDFGDTDLWDNHHDWSEFTKGVELTENGRGVFDFWVYSLGYHGELETNVTVYIEGGKMVRVDGTGNPNMWEAK